MWREAYDLTGMIANRPTPTENIERLLDHIEPMVNGWIEFRSAYLPSPMRKIVETRNEMIARIERMEAAIMTTKAVSLAGAAIQLEVALTIAYGLDFSAGSTERAYAERLHCCLWSAARQAGLWSGSTAPMSVEQYYSAKVGDPFAGGASREA